jgi:hypothetical protein
VKLFDMALLSFEKHTNCSETPFEVPLRSSVFKLLKVSKAIPVTGHEGP